MGIILCGKILHVKKFPHKIIPGSQTHPKRFVFSAIVSSVSFRVIEVGKRIRQSVDLKLHETIWITSSFRLVCSEGFHAGRWMNKHFNGQSFSINCKTNRSGPFVQLDIFGLKRRLKALFIPAGEGCEGLKSFAEALALTTAGPESQVQRRATRRDDTLCGEIRSDGRLFAEVVTQGNRTPITWFREWEMVK